MDLQSKLSQAFLELQYGRFFYYGILKQFVVSLNSEIETMGVNWVNNKMNLYVGSEFLKHYTPLELSYVLEHEACHFTFDHVKNFKVKKPKAIETEEEAINEIKERIKDSVKHKLENIAMDRSINIYIPKLPNIRLERSKLSTNEDDSNKENPHSDAIVGIFQKGATPDKDIVEVQAITESSFLELLRKSGYTGDLSKVARYESWEYYYDLLMQCPKIEEKMNSVAAMDIHLESEGECSEAEMKSAGDRIIMKSYRDSNKANVPGHLREKLEEVLKSYEKSELPWNTLLRRHLHSAKKSIMEEDINTRDVYYNKNNIILTSYRINPLVKIGVVFDVSGSCFDQETQAKFWAEIAAMNRQKTEITVYYTDCEVEHVQKVVPKKQLKAEDYEGKGGGGTNLDVGIVKSIEDGNNIHVMLTDNYMDFSLTKKELKNNKVICVSVTDEKMPEHYGKTIHI